MSFFKFFSWMKPKALPTNNQSGKNFSSSTSEHSSLLSLDLNSSMPDWVLDSQPLPKPLPYATPGPEAPPEISAKTLQHLGSYLEDRFEVSIGALRLFQVLSDPNSSAKEIADAAGADPLLASRILKLVNSAAFGLSKQVSSIGRAIVLLGYNNVKALASQNLIKRRKSKPQNPARMHKLWIHASLVSSCVSSIARKQSNLDSAELASLGLLHDMGKILLSPEEVQTIATQTGLSCPIVEAISGAGFAKSCGLPEILSRSIQAFAWLSTYSPEHIPEDLRRHASLLYFANHACNWYGFHDDDDPSFPSQAVLSYAGFDNNANSWIDSTTARDMEKSRIIIQGFLSLS